MPVCWPVVAAAAGASVAISNDAGTTRLFSFLRLDTSLSITAELRVTDKGSAGCPDIGSE